MSLGGGGAMTCFYSTNALKKQYGEKRLALQFTIGEVGGFMGLIILLLGSYHVLIVNSSLEKWEYGPIGITPKNVMSLGINRLMYK